MARMDLVNDMDGIAFSFFIVCLVYAILVMASVLSDNEKTRRILRGVADLIMAVLWFYILFVLWPKGVLCQ